MQHALTETPELATRGVHLLPASAADAAALHSAPQDLLLQPAGSAALTLHAQNLDATHAKAFFVTIRRRRCRGRDGAQFEQAPWADADGTPRGLATTFVATVPPSRRVALCSLRARALESLGNDIASDIVLLRDGPPPSSTEPCLELGFPFAPGAAFLCTQGWAGNLTHFAHPSTHFAIDLAAEVGTPVLAVGDGVVIALRQASKAWGIDVSLLFEWNSLTLELDGGRGIVEYVHTHADSALVAVGDRVVQGQRLCLSGCAGFCPSPHLHLEAHLEAGASAPSVPFRFQRADGGPAYIAEPGSSYDGARGAVAEALTSTPARSVHADSRPEAVQDPVVAEFAY